MTKYKLNNTERSASEVTLTSYLTGSKDYQMELDRNQNDNLNVQSNRNCNVCPCVQDKLATLVKCDRLGTNELKVDGLDRNVCLCEVYNGGCKLCPRASLATLSLSLDTRDGCQACHGGCTTPYSKSESFGSAAGWRRGAARRARALCSAKTLRRRVPVLEWLPHYSLRSGLADIIAGITVGLTVIPQAIAYAGVAGLPPQYGLYSSFMACFVYAVFGSVKDSAIGPTAIAAILTRENLHGLGPEFAVLLAFLSGCVELLMGILQLGFLIDFISGPVSVGFTSAAAIIIATTQVKDILGLSFPGGKFLQVWTGLYEHIGETRLWDTVLGVTCIVVLLLLRKVKDIKVRGAEGADGGCARTAAQALWFLSTTRNILVVLVCAALAYYFDTQKQTPFVLTGEVKPGLPALAPPPFSATVGNHTYTFMEMTSTLGSAIFVVPLLSILENIALAKVFSEGKYVDATQEMLALGVCNIASSLVESMPVSGALSRGAVNHASGVASTAGGLYTGALVLLALQYFTPYFFYIPKASLAAVIIAAVVFMMELHVFKPIWRTKKLDIIPAVVTFAACLLTRLELGIVIGIAVNLMFLLYASARPSVRVTRAVSGDGVEHIVAVVDRSLAFPSAEYVRRALRKAADAARAAPLVLDATHVQAADFTAAKGIKSLIEEFEARGQAIIFYNVKPSIAGIFRGVRPRPFLHAACRAELDALLRRVAPPPAPAYPEEPDHYYNSATILPKTGLVMNCRWVNDSETLIAHTPKMVIIYDSNGKLVQTHTDLVDRDREILCCVPSNDNRYLIMATSNANHFVDVVDLRTKSRVISFPESEPVLDILTVPGNNKIIILMHNKIVEHALQLSGGSHQNYNICLSRPVISSDQVKKEVTFLSIAVNKAGTLLFVSTDDSRVICIDLKSLSWIFDLENRRGDVISMAVSEVYDFLPGSDVLLTGTGTIENSAKVWYLDPSYVSQNTQKNGKVRLTTKFDVSFVESLTPHTPQNGNGPQSSANTPKRINSFALPETNKKRPVVTTQSLDRSSMKPCLALNLKGICNGTDSGNQPLLAVVDDKNNIQIMRGRKLLTEIVTNANEKISVLKISPCNQYIVYGLPSGSVMKYKLRTKDTRVILNVRSPVQYLNFVTSTLLVAAGKNRCLMVCRLTDNGTWMPEMLQKGNCNLGSQEILNDIQGVKHTNGQSDRLSNSSSESSLNSRRLFPTTDNRGCLSEGTLVNSFWLQDRGLLTVEYNATVKLWDQNLLSNMPGVLNGRQPDVHVNCAAFHKNVLVICDGYNKKFQTFELKDGEQVTLQTIQEYRLNNKITCCDLTADGYVLAMGLDSGNVVLWNVCSKRQIRLLQYHNAKVQWCAFSPVPDRLFRSTTVSPLLSPTNNNPQDTPNQPPLVLVTMAAEIVWWDVSYMIKSKHKSVRPDRLNAISPLVSPVQPRDINTAVDEMSLGPTPNYFFRDGAPGAMDCWKELWKNKTCKKGSKREEILACVKLSGMNAKKLCFDDKFSCFVTVDNPGHVHIMKMMTNT